MKSRIILAIFAILALCASFSAYANAMHDLPNPAWSPGALNPDVTPLTIGKTICVPNWTTTIRPPASYTNKLKAEQMKEHGIEGELHDYEEDHLIPLSIGGNPRDPKNLWPQHWTGDWGAHKKDRLEVAIHKLVCAGKVPLAQAQHEVATDWIAAYKRYVVEK